MNRQIRRVALVVLAAFMALLLAPLYWQVLAAPRLTDDPRNARKLIREYSLQRGSVVLADGTLLAQSVKTNDRLKYLRRYPQGRRYGMLTGFYSLVFGATLIEDKFNEFLVGKAPEQFAQNLTDFLTARDTPGGTLVLTIDKNAQEAAESALGDHKGAVVALDYRTGAVLAMTTFPRYDPNPLSSHDTDTIRKAWAQDNADPDQPLLDRASGQTYPAGSTFKVITAAAAFENGSNPDTLRPNEDSFTPPQTRRAIQNFGGEHCPSNEGNQISLREAFEVSCNTFFAHLGVDLGTDNLVGEAQKFGLNDSPHFQLPAATSRIPTQLDKPSLAQSAIGQRDVQVSPLQMASVAATVANGGVRLAPYVVSRVVGQDEGVVKTFKPDALGQAIPGNVASELQDCMDQVVNGPNGTGSAARIAGLRVFGKTGTAQNAPGKAPHAWFISFTSSGDKSIAVAVIVENGGDLANEATGGHVAAPIAKAVMQAYLGVNG